MVESKASLLRSIREFEEEGYVFDRCYSMDDLYDELKLAHTNMVRKIEAEFLDAQYQSFKMAMLNGDPSNNILINQMLIEMLGNRALMDRVLLDQEMCDRLRHIMGIL